MDMNSLCAIGQFRYCYHKDITKVGDMCVLVRKRQVLKAMIQKHETIKDTV